MTSPFTGVTVADDPLPWLTERFVESGAFERDDHGAPTLAAMAAALRITSSIVTALNGGKHRYAVRFNPSAGSAYTDLKTREVVIGVKPMLDPALTDGQRAALMVALADHEVGHVNYTADVQPAVFKEFGNPNDTTLSKDALALAKWAAKMLNLTHDVLLEHAQSEEFPGYAPTFLVKEGYFGAPFTPRFDTRWNRWGSLIQATLYPKSSDWSGDEAREFFDWATDFAARCRLPRAQTRNGTLELIREGLEHLRLDEPEAEPGEEENMDPPEEFTKVAPPDEDEESDEDEGDDEDLEDDDEGDGASGSGEDEDEDGEDEGADGDPGSTAPGEDGDEDEDLEDMGGSAQSTGDEPDETADEQAPAGEQPGAKADENVGEYPTERLPDNHFNDPAYEAAAGEWQSRIDDLTRITVAGRDRRVVGGGAWEKREVRIIRLPR